MIDVHELTKIFSNDNKRTQIKAVNAITFRCEPGEIYGLLGANGAGKTTTLRMLATILRPTSGTARVAGYDVLSDPQGVRRNVGFLSTATALYGRLTAREMVEYFGRLNGIDGEPLRHAVDELFHILKIDEFSGRRCDNLSTGTKQKVSIARTLIHDPPVMIFDEPTAGLDVMTARTILEFVRTCRSRGKTVIFSTHIMSEAAKLCNRIGIIHNGRIFAEGTLKELQQRYDEPDLEEIFVQATGEEQCLSVMQ
jgi:sodium transport system ATP-binding protein